LVVDLSALVEFRPRYGGPQDKDDEGKKKAD